MPRTAKHSRRSRRASCSIIALATVMAIGATPAAAQSFNATGSYFTNPVAGGITTPANTTNIALNAGQTIIDWTPNATALAPGTNINFQSAGTVANFNGAGDFAVLNRITPADARAIAINGTINARVGGSQRGNVYFYSPNGFVLGGSSIFSVGSLVVTTSPPQLTAGNDFITGFGTTNTVVFGQTPNPNASIVSAGLIDAKFQPLGVPGPADSSYVAMIAPHVTHASSGTIAVNGSAALVAAEAATISFSPDGLFDIAVTAGTTHSAGVEVYGDIGGPAPTGAADRQSVYLVAVPKNQLLTMVIGQGADLGFTLANVATQDDSGAVILSAGHDIVNAAIGGKSAGHGSGTGSFWFTGAHATNNLFGEATGYADLYSVSPNLTTTFDNDVTVHATAHVFMSASGTGASLSVGGDLNLSTNVSGGAGQSLTAGLVQLYALNDAQVSVAGTTTLTANASGGDANSGTAGSGTGGEIWINADDGGSLSLQSVTATALGNGGDGLAAGVNAGQGTGGTLRLYGDDGSSVIVGGALSYDAKGTGGGASGAGLAGTGQGGNSFVYIGDDSIVTINGATTLKSDGQGGAHASGNGGAGAGGESRITSVVDSLTSGLLTFNGNVELSSDGTGGASDGSGTGGTGTGGWARISTPLGSTVDLNGTANLHANGTGGDSEAGTGGYGEGGRSEIESIASNIDISGAVTMRADGTGGASLAPGQSSGNGTGGDILIDANAGTSILFQSQVDARADGDGGVVDAGVNGGDGTGGDIIVRADGTGGTVTFSQGATLFADGEGSILNSDCLTCSAIGGDGFGGSVTFTGTSGGLIDATGFMELSATGSGGSGGSGAAGNGTGGTVLVYAPTGMTMDFTGELQLNGSGDGGFSELGNAAGDGTGNSARLHVDGGTVTVTGELELDADGFGGESGGGGAGGTGSGGRAEILTTGATAKLDVFGNVLVEADGTGGESFNFFEGPLGDGGDGFGGRTIVSADDGKIHITGRLDMVATSTGGAGATGGDAAGTITPPTDEDGPSAAFMWAEADGAELKVDGLTNIDVSATGGDGSSGKGGNANAGEIDIVSQQGAVLLNDVIGNAEGHGGNGGFGGGAGGNGIGGDIDVAWSILDGPINGEISLGTVNLSASGFGGIGGAGLDGLAGGNGGAGGIGSGGWISYVGNAAGGTFNVGTTTLLADGHGGDGGDGGTGSAGVGGNGGAGGIGNTVGFIQAGTISVDLSPGSGGTATFTNLSASSSATGGAGGDGGTGTGGTGTGGIGGSAAAGSASFLVRGIPVTAGIVNLFADATGGDGGSGSTDGNGGNATAGLVSVESKDRFDHETERGSLVATAINGTAIAQGGTGAAPGISTMRGGSYFRVWNGDANIGSVNFNIAGDFYDGTAGPDFIQAEAGTGTVIGNFSYSTSGLLAIYTTSTGSLDIGNLTLSAGNFIDHPTLVGPASLGTIFADNVSVTSGFNFFADANFDVTNTFVVNVPGSIQVGNVNDDNGVDFSANGGSIITGDIDAGTFVDLYAYDSINTGDIDAGSSVTFDAWFGSIGVGAIDAGGNVSLTAGTFITGQDIIAGGSIFAQTFGGDIGLDALTSAFGSITLDANGDIFLSGDALADGDIELTANGNILMNNATAGESITLDAGGYLDEGGGYIDGLNLTAGDSIDVVAAEWVDLGNLSAGLVDPSTSLDADYTAAILAGGNINVGNISAAQHIGLATPGTITTLDLNAGGIIMALGTGDMDFGNATAGDDIYLADYSMMALGGTITDEFDPVPILNSVPTPTGGSITILDVNAGKFTAAAGTDLTTGSINSDGGIGLGANGAISTGDLVAGDFVLANAGSITTGSIDADSVDMTSMGGNITVNGDIEAFGSVELDAFLDILTDNITAGSIDLFAGGDITTLDLTTQQLVLDLVGGITTMLFPGASITLESGGDILTGAISSIDGVYADAGGSLTTGTIDAVDFVELFAVNNILTQDITAGNDLRITSTSGGIDTGDLAGTDIELEADDDIAFDDVDGYDFDFSAGGSVTGLDIIVAQKALGDAGGTITLGNITAGPIIPFDDFSVGIAAVGNIIVQDVSGAGHVGFATTGNLTTGDVTAGDLVMTLVGGNTTTGAITTTDEFGQVYMADDSMFFAAGGTLDGADDFDVSLVLGEDPVPTGGSITINGPVDTNLFQAAAGTGLTTQAIVADEIEASAGGTATLNGVWNVTNAATLKSNDIDITSTGGIDGGTTGDILLISTNPTQMLVGDGLSGTGYALSNAEFGRLSGTDVAIVGRGDASAASDMLIGDLTVTGPSAGSTIESSEGILVFAVGDIDSESPSGVIRVVGDINATGFGSGNAIEFYADRFELDATTGSVSILSSGSTLGGELGLYADRIHVAETAILNQLAINPTYTNYQQDLNKAATVQRPEGVLRADTLWIESDNLQGILIQNMGTAGTPAGFVVRQAFINDDFEVAGPPGSINLVVNGQVVTEGGTLTGVAARDALVTPEDDITPFTSNSTINGCPLTGACIIRPPEPPPIANVVDNQIDLITGNPLGDGEFGNEDSIDDNEEGDEGANNPISPPQPLFDTRPLIPSSDVDDPVSGTGNPALLGGVGDCIDDENNQCGTKKEEGQ